MPAIDPNAEQLLEDLFGQGVAEEGAAELGIPAEQYVRMAWIAQHILSTHNITYYQDGLSLDCRGPLGPDEAETSAAGARGSRGRGRGRGGRGRARARARGSGIAVSDSLEEPAVPVAPPPRTTRAMRR